MNSIRELDLEGPDKLVIGSTAPAIYSLAPAIVTALREYLPGTEVRISVLSTEQQGGSASRRQDPRRACASADVAQDDQPTAVGSAKIVLALSAQHKLAAWQVPIFFLVARREGTAFQTAGAAAGSRTDGTRPGIIGQRSLPLDGTW